MQALRDYVDTQLECLTPAAIDDYWDYIGNVNTARGSVAFMQLVRIGLHGDIGGCNKEAKLQFGQGYHLAERSALCLAAFSFRRAEIRGPLGQNLGESALVLHSISWDDRIALFNQQPDGVRSDISCYLQSIVAGIMDLCDFAGPWTEEWVVQKYYTSGDPEKLMTPAEFKIWYVTVGAAITMNVVVKSWNEVVNKSVHKFRELCQDEYDVFEGILDKEMAIPGASKDDKQLQGAVRFVQSIEFDRKSSLAPDYVPWPSVGGRCTVVPARKKSNLTDCSPVSRRDDH